MAKKRWMLGTYELKINPKSEGGEFTGAGSVNYAANGLASINNLYYEKSIDFTFDVYQKPSTIERLPMVVGTTTVFVAPWMTEQVVNSYGAISERRLSGEIYCLRKSVIDVYDAAGVYKRQFTANTVAGGTPVALTVSDNSIILLYNNMTLVIQDEINTQIAKYTYTDNDLLDATAIVFDYDTHGIYAINKYGKIFLLQETLSTSDLVYQFSDFATNKAASSARYNSIHMVKGYVGVLKDNYKLYYLNKALEVIHGIELQNNTKQLTDMCFGQYSQTMMVLGLGNIYMAQLDLCGIDIDIIKSLIAKGIVSINDDSNIRRIVAINSSNIRRLRNKQDARYEVQISGVLI